MRVDDTDCGLPQKSGEDLGGRDLRGGRGRIGRVFYLSELMSSRVDLDDGSRLWEREGRRGLVWR